MLLLVSAVGIQGVHGAVGQAGVHAPRPVSLADHFTDRQTQRLGQALTAVVDVMRQARPAAFNVLLVGFFEASRRFHAFRAPGTAFGVTHAVQRRNHLFTEFGAFFQNGVDHIRRGFFAAGQALIVFFITQKFIADEANVTQGSLVFGHGTGPQVFISMHGQPRLRLWWLRGSRFKQTFETYVYAKALSTPA